MNNPMVPLDILAREINACHDKAAGYDKKAEEFRNTRNQKIHEAYRRITIEKEIDMAFSDWVRDNIIDITLTQVRRICGPLVQHTESEQKDTTPTSDIGHSEKLQSTSTEIDPWIMPVKVADLVEAAYNNILSTLTFDQVLELTKRLVAECNRMAAERKADTMPYTKPDTPEYREEVAAFYAARRQAAELG